MSLWLEIPAVMFVWLWLTCASGGTILTFGVRTAIRHRRPGYKHAQCLKRIKALEVELCIHFETEMEKIQRVNFEIERQAKMAKFAQVKEEIKIKEVGERDDGAMPWLDKAIYNTYRIPVMMGRGSRPYMRIKPNSTTMQYEVLDGRGLWVDCNSYGMPTSSTTQKG